ncbi:MAG: hypothetical protein ACI4QM_02870, partial [Alphaproteobacteria bacterium]
MSEISEVENIERIASELMDAGKYDAAAMYWQKDIDTGLLDIGQEDGAWDLIERCQYCHEKGCEPYETYGHALSSQYYFADEVSFNAIEKYKGDDFKNALDKVSKTPEYSELNYADQWAVKETINVLSDELNNMSSDETYYTEMIEYTLGNL